MVNGLDWYKLKLIDFIAEIPVITINIKVALV